MEAIAGLAGVIIGFLLSELATNIRARKKLDSKKQAIYTELRSLKGQIPQLKNICGQAINELRAKALLPTIAVPALTGSYDAFGHEVLETLNQKERNCLHIIYGRLKVADKVLFELEQDFRLAMEQSVFSDTFEAFVEKLTEIHMSYDVINGLIDSYLAGNPTDVFYLDGQK